MESGEEGGRNRQTEGGREGRSLMEMLQQNAFVPRGSTVVWEFHTVEVILDQSVY